ncbi:MAG: CPBP family intramembrane metalloprotease [Amaricoccus sp.]
MAARTAPGRAARRAAKRGRRAVLSRLPAPGLATRFRSPLVWGLLPALAFGALHWNPADQGHAAPLAVVSATLAGLLLADITVRTGSLSAAIGLHVANNVVALLVLAPASGLDALALFVLPAPPGALVAVDLAATLVAGALWLALRPQSGASM